MECDIKLDNCTFGFYRPGDEVTGSVIVKVRSQVKFSRLILAALGQGYIQWTEKHGDSRTQHRNNEHYLDSEVKIYGSAETDGSLLSAGSHSFPFHFVLPFNIPQCVEISCDKSTFGYIRYLLRLTVDKGGMIETSPVYEHPFYICGSLDLNSHLESLKPVEFSNKVGSNDCCGMSAQSLTVRLPRRAYTPGEEIIIEGDFDNSTDDHVRSLEFSLCEKVVFVTKDKIFGSMRLTNTLQHVLASTSRGDVKAGVRDQWKGLVLGIPWITVPQLVGCSIIELHYSLRVMVISQDGKSKNIIQVPLTIGAVPLAGMTPMQDQDRLDFAMTPGSRGGQTPLQVQQQAIMMAPHNARTPGGNSNARTPLLATTAA